ncbi:MAG: peptidylprolyl isomerase [Planctomycetota bacterium]
MTARFLTAALPWALLLPALPAQVPTPLPAAGENATPVSSQPSEAKPEAAREPTPEERVAGLEREIQMLQRELEQIKSVDRSGGVAARVKAQLADRAIDAPSIEAAVAPAGADVLPSTTERRGARLLGDAEKTALGEDVIFTVDGLPVTKAEFDAAYAYLNSYPQEAGEQELRQRAVMELIRLKAAMAAFKEGTAEALAKAEAAQERLERGAAGDEFAAIARAESDCPSKRQGGDLGMFGREGMDFNFTKTAFGLEVGETSKPIASVFGYHIIKVTGREKGTDAAQDRVRASHILATFSNDQLARQQVMQRANDGDVDVGFVSDEYRKYAPDVFQR